ncbi:SH3 domain-containing protein [Metabacillus sp. GX 13764]|uniref:SH3 domain-containing protein n=1 Tax=Metabacillus kandeliae TaxID=2900151 RepID=UPI001E59012F|nr:SH3 domain-containing protein [Metabacillus kandeliae]MCD7034463.1 SH3 domain-containing protein [Metabacillus kandeliae]
MKKTTIALVFGAGLLVGGAAAPLASTSAASNVVLASVDWVNSQLNPQKDRITKLESDVASLRQALEDTSTSIPTLPSQVYVKSLSADIHSGALYSYRVVSSGALSQSLKVTQQVTAADGKFYRVEYAPNQFGWIAAADVSYSAVAAPSSVIVKTSASVYSGANTKDYKTVGTVTKGQQVKYLGTFKNSKTNEVWFNVQLSNGKAGWLQSQNGEVK